MAPDKLVYMANQIADYFRSYPDADAVRGIAEHIEAFWTGDMRRRLTARIADSREGVDRLVAAAILPATVPSVAQSGENPILKEVAGPDELGQIASDAG